MPTLEEFCTITAALRPRMLGKTPSGVRIDFAFEGSAVSPHWEGPRPVSGVDYAPSAPTETSTSTSEA